MKLLSSVKRSIFVVFWGYINFNDSISTFLSCSWYQTTKPFFPRIFLSLTRWKRKQTFDWSKTKKKPILDQLKICFLFQLLKLRKFRGKNWGKQDSWFDVTNKIFNTEFTFCCFQNGVGDTSSSYLFSWN